jgi:uncharacterized protein (DUF2267 family)
VVRTGPDGFRAVETRARGAVEAVFNALRETIPHVEFLDVTAELPDEYASVDARPRRV